MRTNKGGGDNFSRNPAILSLRTRAELVGYIDALFTREGSADEVGIDRGKLRAFIARVGRHYRYNPYHNFHHAADVVNTMAWMITRPVFRRELSPAYRFLLLLVALVHDIEHPGHNNQFEVDNRTDLARRYDNEAVLEKYSLDITMALLDQPEYDLFGRFDPETQAEWRRIVGELILATDFQQHRPFMDAIGRFLDHHPVDFRDPEFVSWVTRGLIKAADIANTSKPFEDAKLWGRRVMMEFWAQGLQEKARNLPVGPFNDPEKVKLNAAQAGFIKFAAMELFELLGRVDPALNEMVDNLSSNLERYEAIARRGEQLLE